MGLDAGDKKVYDLLNDKMYTVAANQRKYVWTRNNWQELLDDLELVYNEHTNSHFIGSVVLKKESATKGIRNQYSIIDGQQRISTLTIVLCAIGLIFAENEQQEYFDGLNKPLFVMDNRNRPHPIVSDKANKSISGLVVKLFENANAHFSEGTALLTSDQLLKQEPVTVYPDYLVLGNASEYCEGKILFFSDIAFVGKPVKKLHHYMLQRIVRRIL